MLLSKLSLILFQSIFVCKCPLNSTGSKIEQFRISHRKFLRNDFCLRSILFQYRNHFTSTAPLMRLRGSKKNSIYFCFSVILTGNMRLQLKFLTSSFNSTVWGFRGTHYFPVHFGVFHNLLKNLDIHLHWRYLRMQAVQYSLTSYIPLRGKWVRNFFSDCYVSVIDSTYKIPDD